jgi:hypothetical protein
MENKNTGYVSEETFKYALDAQREHYATIIKRLLICLIGVSNWRV